MKLWESFRRPIWILHSTCSAFLFCNVNHLASGLFIPGWFSTLFIRQHQRVCAHGLNSWYSFFTEIHFDTVTHLLWTTQLGLVSTFMFMYEVNKSYFEPFPFIDIVNSCNFDPVRLIISRMKRYKAYTLRWGMSFSKWFIYPKANWFPSKYSVLQCYIKGRSDG